MLRQSNFKYANLVMPPRTYTNVQITMIHFTHGRRLHWECLNIRIQLFVFIEAATSYSFFQSF